LTDFALLLLDGRRFFTAFSSVLILRCMALFTESSFDVLREFLDLQDDFGTTANFGIEFAYLFDDWLLCGFTS
jgi:hypothetical protein